MPPLSYGMFVNDRTQENLDRFLLSASRKLSTFANEARILCPSVSSSISFTHNFPPSTLQGLVFSACALLWNASLVVGAFLGSVASPMFVLSVIFVLALIPKDINSLREINFM